MPPRCSRVLSLLTDYLDGHLASDVRTDLDRHLNGCSECAAFVASYRFTVSLLQSLSEDDLPPELRLRLRAFLDDRCKS
jgi:anti-sigma factor RsiW